MLAARTVQRDEDAHRDALSETRNVGRMYPSRSETLLGWLGGSESLEGSSESSEEGWISDESEIDDGDGMDV